MSLALPRHAEKWAPGLLRSWMRDRTWRPLEGEPPICWLLFTDHWEPFGMGASASQANAMVDRWADGWPRIAAGQRDDFGRPPCFTFFYPEEEYDRRTLDLLAAMTQKGIADVEIHLHHDGESEPDFNARMTGFIERLMNDHGLLRLDSDGRPGWCFIHGNWALDNSHPDGRWCGLNNELTLLRELGCRADFTLPSAPSGCQTSMVNAIYWAVDDPVRPKSHDTGTLLAPGVLPPAQSLLMVQGPLTVRQHPRNPLLPTLEVGELASNAMPSPARAQSWLRAAPRVGNHLFVKLFGHGAQMRNGPPLLDGGFDRCIDQLRDACHARGYQLGFLSAWETNRLLRGIAAGTDSAARAPEWLRDS